MTLGNFCHVEEGTTMESERLDGLVWRLVASASRRGLLHLLLGLPLAAILIDGDYEAAADGRRKRRVKRHARNSGTYSELLA